MSNINLILPGLIIGTILYQTMFVAPTVFQTIDSENTSKFLRKIFPRYYLLLFLITLLALLISYLFFEIFDVYIAIVAVFFSFFGYIIIPLTNSARDRGWDNLFKWLHNLSVFNTVVIMAIAIVQIFRATTL